MASKLDPTIQPSITGPNDSDKKLKKAAQYPPGDSSFQSKHEQLAYLDQCLTWSKSEDRGSLAVKFRENPQLIDNIIAHPLLDLEVSKKLLQILTSTTVTKPTKSSKEIFKRIYISLFDNNFFELNGPFIRLIENTIHSMSSLKTRESKDFKITLETLTNIISLIEVLINKLPDKQHLLLLCITQLLTSSQDAKMISKELKDKIKRLSAITNKFKCTEVEYSKSDTAKNQQDTPSETSKKETITFDKSPTQVSHQSTKISSSGDVIKKEWKAETLLINDNKTELNIQNPEASSRIASESGVHEHSSTSNLKLKCHILPRSRSDLAPKRYTPPHSFSSPVSYVDSLFRDLREEALFPIRKTIRNYFSKRSNPKSRNRMFVYEDVRCESTSCSEKEGVMFNISFTPIGIPDLSIYRWEKSSRLRYGSLLCIFTKRRNGKYFDKIYFATVARREARILSKRQSISIHFESIIPPEFDPRLEYYMIESKNYHFYHLHKCLSALQTIDPHKIPLTSAILSQQLPPDSSKGLGSWDLGQSKMDSSRNAAITFALSNRVSLFQTHTVLQNSISESLIRTLLYNRHKMQQSLPITPTCHLDERVTLEHLKEICRKQGARLDIESYSTLCFSPLLMIFQNRESMDSFLESLFTVEDNFIRLYSWTSPHTCLAERSFYEVSKRLLNTHDSPSEIRKLRSKIHDLKKKLSENKLKFRQLSSRYFDCSLLTQSDIKQLACPEHYDSLFNSKSSSSKPHGILTIDHWLSSNKPSSLHFEPRSDSSNESQDHHVTYQETTGLDFASGNYSDEICDFEDNGEVAYCNYDRDDGDAHRSGVAELPNCVDGDSEFSEVEEYSDSDDGDSDFEFFDEIVQEDTTDLGGLNLVRKFDVWEMDLSERNKLYALWDSKHRAGLLQNISVLSKEIEALINQIKNTLAQMDVCVMKSSPFIATTPEEAVKFHLQLRGVKPRILIVHNSCGIRESELLPLFPENLKLLILFHNQDQQTNTPYMENIRSKSLFQRLIKIGYEPFSYSPQLTLRPEIARLTSSYRSIESTPNLPNVRGVAKNLFFLNVVSHEQRVRTRNGVEYSNEQEASFLVQFAKYLLKQGYSETDLCIATIYSAQIDLVDSILTKARLEQINLSLITPSANLRNKIALISLVRSNRENDIGVLNNADVVYAAFTSASEGLYVIGDADCIQASDRRADIWNVIFNELRDNIGKKLQLSCQTHRNITLVEKDKDFRRARNGGCLTPCDIQLKCGHKCPQICHPDPHVGSECFPSCAVKNTNSQQSVDLHLKHDALPDSDNAIPVEAVTVNCEDFW